MSLEKKFQQLLRNLKKNNEAYAKIALIGQPGAGKSSIVNALLGKNVAATGVGTDTTVEAMEYEYHFNKLVDLPGYGTKMFSMDVWKKRFNPDKFDVWFFVFSGKLMKEDTELLRDLVQLNEETRQNHPLFLIRNHSEEILTDDDMKSICSDIYNRLHQDASQVPIFFVDCRYKTGFKELSDALEKINYRSIWEQRIIKCFSEKCSDVLKKCRLKSLEIIDSYKIKAGVNGVNPIPGLDVAVDVGIYMSMFSDIRSVYDIEQEDLDRFSVMPVVKKLMELATKNGIIILLKNFASRMVVKNTMKYIPILGQISAAVMGYKLCQMAGEDYINDCQEAAEEILQRMVVEQLNLWEQEKEMLLLGGK